MKCIGRVVVVVDIAVAPLAGAWVEISIEILMEPVRSVAPLAGAWVEIYVIKRCQITCKTVAPLAGAWVEIAYALHKLFAKHRRSPRGSVG